MSKSSQPIYVPLLGTGLLSEQEGLGYSSHAGPVRIGNFTRTIELLRSDGQWQCDNGFCIPEAHKCDGAFHCEDGSDETRANCKNKKRHNMLGLVMHCIADRLNMKDGVCPDICKLQPEYCAYAILSEQSPAPPGTCALPDFDRNGTYRVIKLDSTSVFEYEDFYLDFECANGTELVGEAKPKCVNGTWDSKMPNCLETCKLNKKDDHKYTCKRGDKSKPCGNLVAIETEVIIERKLDKKISNSTITVSTMCTKDQKFNVSKDCVSVVESRQGEFEKDIMNQLASYEIKFKETQHPSPEFEKLVRNYRDFEDKVTKNNTDLWIQVTTCDIYLDLMETS
ncbi:hypothetical protein MSG28_012527 [Choristoneura fumiferana]|uniref:Uncharacterized protein n=1 Tax=Choristoneura fumiferana TaxID=7141 RepID=A0ACC0KE99_CHOFU|nr:hypothetical protein MSG28_012527 [Choristoneura fumiferana]